MEYNIEQQVSKKLDVESDFTWKGHHVLTHEGLLEFKGNIFQECIGITSGTLDDPRSMTHFTSAIQKDGVLIFISFASDEFKTHSFACIPTIKQFIVRSHSEYIALTSTGCVISFFTSGLLKLIRVQKGVLSIAEANHNVYYLDETTGINMLPTGYSICIHPMPTKQECWFFLCKGVPCLYSVCTYSIWANLVRKHYVFEEYYKCIPVFSVKDRIDGITMAYEPSEIFFWTESILWRGNLITQAREFILAMESPIITVAVMDDTRFAVVIDGTITIYKDGLFLQFFDLPIPSQIKMMITVESNLYMCGGDGVWEFLIEKMQWNHLLAEKGIERLFLWDRKIFCEDCFKNIYIISK
jgi:hypothetical protein